VGRLLVTQFYTGCCTRRDDFKQFADMLQWWHLARCTMLWKFPRGTTYKH
jgi:hypothetical protein